jgi:hypothetical protein
VYALIKAKHKKTDRQKQEVLLDTLWRNYIRMRAMNRVGGCERCHTSKTSFLGLQAAHLFSRNSHTAKWDIMNGAGLCGGCHMYIDDHAEVKVEFAKQLIDEEEYERLYVLANMTTKQSPVDLKLKEIELRELLKEV